MRKHVLLYGGFDKGAIIGHTSMVLAFLMVFAGVKSYRRIVGKHCGSGNVVPYRSVFPNSKVIATSPGPAVDQRDRSTLR